MRYEAMLRLNARPAAWRRQSSNSATLTLLNFIWFADFAEAACCFGAGGDFDQYA